MLNLYMRQYNVEQQEKVLITKTLHSIVNKIDQFDSKIRATQPVRFRQVLFKDGAAGPLLDGPPTPPFTKGLNGNWDGQVGLWT